MARAESMISPMSLKAMPMRLSPATEYFVGVRLARRLPTLGSFGFLVQLLLSCAATGSQSAGQRRVISQSVSRIVLEMHCVVGVAIDIPFIGHNVEWHFVKSQLGGLSSNSFAKIT
jgi:hypothetical protein